MIYLGVPFPRVLNEGRSRSLFSGETAKSLQPNYSHEAPVIRTYPKHAQLCSPRRLFSSPYKLPRRFSVRREARLSAKYLPTVFSELTGPLVGGRGALPTLRLMPPLVPFRSL